MERGLLPTLPPVGKEPNLMEQFPPNKQQLLPKIALAHDG